MSAAPSKAEDEARAAYLKKKIKDRLDRIKESEELNLRRLDLVEKDQTELMELESVQVLPEVAEGEVPLEVEREVVEPSATRTRLFDQEAEEAAELEAARLRVRELEARQAARREAGEPAEAEAEAEAELADDAEEEVVVPPPPMRERRSRQAQIDEARQAQEDVRYTRDLEERNAALQERIAQLEAGVPVAEVVEEPPPVDEPIATGPVAADEPAVVEETVNVDKKVVVEDGGRIGWVSALLAIGGGILFLYLSWKLCDYLKANSLYWWSIGDHAQNLLVDAIVLGMAALGVIAGLIAGATHGAYRPPEWLTIVVVIALLLLLIVAWWVPVLAGFLLIALIVLAVVLVIRLRPAPTVVEEA